jgi:hypothetical protein
MMRCTCKRTVPSDPDTREHNPACPWHGRGGGEMRAYGKMHAVAGIMPMPQTGEPTPVVHGACGTDACCGAC